MSLGRRGEPAEVALFLCERRLGGMNDSYDFVIVGGGLTASSWRPLWSKTTHTFH